MSVVKKNQLRERFTKINAAFAAEGKAQQAAKSKKVSADLVKYFEENPNENVFVGEIDVEGDRNVSIGVVQQARPLGQLILVSRTGRRNADHEGWCRLWQGQQ